MTDVFSCFFSQPLVRGKKQKQGRIKCQICCSQIKIGVTSAYSCFFATFSQMSCHTDIIAATFYLCSHFSGTRKNLGRCPTAPIFPKNASAYLHFLGNGKESNISKEKRFTQASVLPEILLPIFAKDLLQFFSGFFHPCIFKAPEVIKCSFVAVSSQIEPIICIQSLYDQVQFLKN